MKSFNCNFVATSHSKKKSTFNRNRCQKHEQYLELDGCDSETSISELIKIYKQSCPEKITSCDAISNEEKDFYQDIQSGTQDMSKWDDIKNIITKNTLNENLLKDCRTKRLNAQKCYLDPDSPNFKQLEPSIQEDIINHIRYIDKLNLEIDNCQLTNQLRRNATDILRQRSISTLRQRSPSRYMSRLSINPTVDILYRPQSIRPLSVRPQIIQNEKTIELSTPKTSNLSPSRTLKTKAETSRMSPSRTLKAETSRMSPSRTLKTKAETSRMSPSRTLKTKTETSRMSPIRMSKIDRTEKTKVDKKGKGKEKKESEDYGELFLSRQDILNRELIDELNKFPLGKRKIEQLLKEGADPNYVSPDDATPFQYATWTHNLELIKLFIKYGGDVNKFTSLKSPFFMGLIIDDKEIEDLLFKAGGDIEKKDKAGFRILFTGITDDNLSLIEKVLQYGASIHSPIIKDDALLLAIVKGNKDTIDLLLKYGADINHKYEEGLTPIFFSMTQNDLSLIKHLVERGADITALDKDNNNVLSYYVRIKKYNDSVYPIIKYAVEHGVNINQQNKNGLTPFISAIINNDLPLVKYLVSLGADINMKNNKGLTPLQYAIAENNLSIAGYLFGLTQKSTS